ncbi:hypothetical protein F2Q68_00002261 [Brassica cretica]|uniref:Uncharacterized protein n=1 Tax=Brassica cretica TaxID=69181 RepID=A0A8S9JED5_BRACR|nr:hypothetical protein F2Q68_00002261 [Brassica cretica]
MLGVLLSCDHCSEMIASCLMCCFFLSSITEDELVLIEQLLTMSKLNVEKKRASEAPRRKKQRQPKMSREPVAKLVPVAANFGEEAALENANELELVQCRGEVAAMLQYVHRFCQLHKSKQDPSTMLVRRCQPLQVRSKIGDDNDESQEPVVCELGRFSSQSRA